MTVVDIEPIISGTTRNLDLTLNNDADTPVPINLTLIDNIVWQVIDTNYRVMIWKHYVTGQIELLGDPINGQCVVILAADDTSPAFGVGSATDVMSYTYETRVYFTDGAQEVVLTGSFTLDPTTSWKSITAPAAGADRVVYVQGRY